eukprot:6209453-Pleurochrysis_carterae.AAC.3
MQAARRKQRKRSVGVCSVSAAFYPAVALASGPLALCAAGQGLATSAPPHRRGGVEIVRSLMS